MTVTVRARAMIGMCWTGCTSTATLMLRRTRQSRCCLPKRASSGRGSCLPVTSAQRQSRGTIPKHHSPTSPPERVILFARQLQPDRASAHTDPVLDSLAAGEVELSAAMLGQIQNLQLTLKHE